GAAPTSLRFYTHSTPGGVEKKIARCPKLRTQTEVCATGGRKGEDSETLFVRERFDSRVYIYRVDPDRGCDHQDGIDCHQCRFVAVIARAASFACRSSRRGSSTGSIDARHRY